MKLFPMIIILVNVVSITGCVVLHKRSGSVIEDVKTRVEKLERIDPPRPDYGLAQQVAQQESRLIRLELAHEQMAKNFSRIVELLERLDSKISAGVQ